MSAIRKRMVEWSFAALAALAAAAAAAQTDEALTVPLTDPARPVTLEVAILRGSIAVAVHDRPEVVIVARPAADDDDDDDDDTPEGFRRIPNTSVALTAEERDNTVTVKTDVSHRNVELVISVPRQTSVRVSATHGDIRISGLTGEHELTNRNGDVTAVDIAGAAVAGTSNGDVRVSFTEIQAGKAMSFSTFNGDVDVTFPASLAANLRVNSGRGDLLTDFDVEVRQQPAVVEQGSGGDGRYQVRMEQTLLAVVGGGGPDMQFRTFNGDVTIRRR